MLYIQKEKRKQLLVLGFIGMALFAVGDVLLQSFADKGEDILLLMFAGDMLLYYTPKDFSYGPKSPTEKRLN